MYSLPHSLFLIPYFLFPILFSLFIISYFVDRPCVLAVNVFPSLFLISYFADRPCVLAVNVFPSLFLIPYSLFLIPYSQGINQKSYSRLCMFHRIPNEPITFIGTLFVCRRYKFTSMKKFSFHSYAAQRLAFTH